MVPLATPSLGPELPTESTAEGRRCEWRGREGGEHSEYDGKSEWIREIMKTERMGNEENPGGEFSIEPEAGGKRSWKEHFPPCRRTPEGESHHGREGVEGREGQTDRAAWSRDTRKG